MRSERLSALVWFGVLGGPLAWATQFVVGYELGLARCESPTGRFKVPFHAWAIGLASAAILVALLAEAAAIAVFRATREDERLRERRIHFLAIVAMTVNPLVLLIAAMSGAGTSLLSLCNQS